MPTFPTVRPPSRKTSPSISKPQIKTTSEDGYTKSRPRATRTLKAWSLRWDYLSRTDYDLLETFLEDNMGNSFTWTHPYTSVVYTCRFTDNSLGAEEETPDYLSGVTCSIETV